ncbi:G2/mitotic-specific cyclin-B1 [Intoshia linei]|uniref:G2/mitotic-specific cyclin-B1 n=1 Tax=Intoshia linei TaxID=1819745 RepID=A0A177B1N5_9BILA|nr:G2/mitotic-specific cyclin-B1 [Intoshia linei]
MFKIQDIENIGYDLNGHQKLNAKKEITSRKAFGNISNARGILKNAKDVKALKNKDCHKVSIKPEVEKQKANVTAKLANTKVSYDGTRSINLPDYTDDIYNYLFKLESVLSIRKNYFLEKTHFNSAVRSVVVEWMLQVCSRFEMDASTFQLSVSLLDRYMQIVDINKEDIQIVACSVILIGGKFEELLIPPYEDFLYVTDNIFTSDDIQNMEIDILTLSHIEYLASKYLIDICLMDSKLCHIPPSQSAAAASLLVQKLSKIDSFINYEDITSYSKRSLEPIVRRICIDILQIKSVGHFMTVYKKNCEPKMHFVSENVMFKDKALLKLFASGVF